MDAAGAVGSVSAREAVLSNDRLLEAFKLRHVSPLFKLCAIRIGDQTHEYEVQFMLCLQDIANFACCSLGEAESVLNEMQAKRYIASWQFLDDETTDIELWFFPENADPFASRNEPVRKSLSPRLRQQIFERDGKVCAYCETTDGPFHIDHIRPRSLGGSDDPENLTVACATCNLSKRDKTLEEWQGANGHDSSL